MKGSVLVAVLAALMLSGPAAACTEPQEAMPFDVWAYHPPRVLIHEGDCVIDPGFWTHTSPPHLRGWRMIAM